MKCVTKLFCLAWMISSTTMGCATELPSWRATPARRALADGAIVTLQIHVVDETGAPVEDASVGVGFWAPQGWGAENDQGETDETGYVELEARCRTDGTLVAKKEGYYPSRLHVDYIATDDEAIEETLFSRRWKEPQPVQITLKRVRNPIPMIAWHATTSSFKFPTVNGTCSLDVESLEWCPPYGEGKHADITFILSGIYRERQKDTVPTKVIMKCERPGDGLAFCQSDHWSRFQSAYQVSSDMEFKQQQVFEFKPWKSVLPYHTYLVFRVRAELNAEGEIISAHYGKCRGLTQLNPRGLISFFDVYFNPVPNDTNLEFDTKRNLAPGETWEQHRRRRVYLP